MASLKLPIQRSQAVKRVGSQVKTAPVVQTAKRPVAPAVYRPQPLPRVLQTKAARNQQSPISGGVHAPAPPQVYRPQPTPRVLQTKKTPLDRTVNLPNARIPIRAAQSKRTTLQTRLVPPPASGQKQPLGGNVMQLYRKFADAPGEGGAFKTIAGEADGVKYHVRIDRDSQEFQRQSFVSATLFSSLHVVIEDDNFSKYYPHYYYDDDGKFVRRDNQNLDKGHYRRLADAVVTDLVKSKGYPKALSKEEVDAIRVAEAEQLALREGKQVENKKKAEDNRELHVETQFLKEQARRKKLKLKPLTLIDYNGSRYRGKYMMSPVELLPVGKDEQ